MYKYQTGGGVTVPDTEVGQEVGRSGALAEFAGPYVTEMLGRGQAISEQPYQAYTGPLAAGASDMSALFDASRSRTTLARSLPILSRIRPSRAIAFARASSAPSSAFNASFTLD